jgi:hypothetical protein
LAQLNPCLYYKEFKVIQPKLEDNSTILNPKVMINPPEPPSVPKPHISELGLSPQVFSPEVTKEAPSNFASPILPTRRTSFHSSMISISTNSKRAPMKTIVVKVETERESNPPSTSV